MRSCFRGRARRLWACWRGWRESVRATFDEASRGAGVDLWALSQQGPDTELNRTENTQPALLAAGVAVWRVWQDSARALPEVLAGHSLGEYTALVCAGVLNLTDAAALVRERGRLMQDAVPLGVGAMAAVLGAEDALIAEVCAEVAAGEVVSPANFNSPGQTVIAGHASAVDRALARLAERGVRKAVKLPVSVPSHCALMREAAQRVGERSVAARGMRRAFRWCKTPTHAPTTTWRRFKTPWCVSSIFLCAGPNACKRWPRRASTGCTNAARARYWQA